VPRRRWAQFLEDARAFRASGFAVQARALGWTEADLFGCNELRPFARIDCMGLISLLNGDRIVALTAEGAVIEAKGGSQLTYQRKGCPSRLVGMLVPRFSAEQPSERHPAGEVDGQMPQASPPPVSENH
jgi:hypothetical protein